MANLQLFDQLLQFPLFQGMSRDDLSRVAGHTRFGFVKHPARQTVVTAGDTVGSLLFLLSGELQVVTSSADGKYRVEERVGAPWLLQPEAIFGYNQHYTHTFTTLSDASFLQIAKDEVVKLSSDFLVFRINMLNIFATQAQKQLQLPWRDAPTSLRNRIVRFLADHTVQPSGPKTFHILMTRLAAEVGDSRLDVSRVLNRLQADGLLQLHRGRIEIPDMESLVNSR